jgi:predicted nucleic acid-binding protein
MPKPRVYVETTIPNVYYETRTSPKMIERQAWTRAWWADAAEKYELLTSVIVLDELKAGTSRNVRRRVALLDGLIVLPITPPIPAIASTYIRHKLMPATPAGDAYHLAIASFRSCDYIVTWNCKHLANPRKALHIRKITRCLD